MVILKAPNSPNQMTTMVVEVAPRGSPNPFHTPFNRKRKEKRGYLSNNNLISK